MIIVWNFLRFNSWEKNNAFFCTLQDFTTPLILAAAGGHRECVLELLEQGADPNARRIVSILLQSPDMLM